MPANRFISADISTDKNTKKRANELNRRAAELEGSGYASRVLFHEFLHCLGFLKHDKEFRKLEEMWPCGLHCKRATADSVGTGANDGIGKCGDCKNIGIRFTEYLTLLAEAKRKKT